MDWRIKGILQKILSQIHGGMSINTYLQQKLGGLRNFSSSVNSKIVNDWAILMQHTNDLGINISGKNMMEIGTGWFPVFPLCYYLAGASSCATFDLNRHLNTELTNKMVKILGDYCDIIACSCKCEINCTFNDIVTRYNELQIITGTEELLTHAGIYYRAPSDATKTTLANESIDIVYSNSVLEHIPYSVIVGLMKEAKRILKKGGISIHSINCGDHYAYFDKKIKFNNYLKFNDKQWQLWNNNLLYQNRLRPIDFVRIVEQLGFEVILLKQKPQESLLDHFSYNHVSSQFKKYSIEQLCTTSLDFVAIKQ